MEINETIVIGRLGQQPLNLSDPGIEPHHATLTRKDKNLYVIEDNNSAKGIFVFGLKVKRKSIKEETPIFLGAYKTSVKQRLMDSSTIDLEQIWNEYDKEKRKWDRYATLVNSIRMLTPILTMLITQVIGQNWLTSCIVLIVVMIIAMIAGEKVMSKKNIRMAELNVQMQNDYVCPHCHKFLSLTPYKVLHNKKYCPACGVPLN